MKANFKVAREDKFKDEIAHEPKNEKKKDITEEEFEEFIIKSGAAGSFMIFRSDKKKSDEMGLDEI